MDTRSLVEERLRNAEAERRRRREWEDSPYVIVLIGDKPVSGEFANPPKRGMNTIWLKEVETKPATMIHWSSSFPALQEWFEEHTVKTGPNVWRWK
jgi:hypothetical protein